MDEKHGRFYYTTIS